MAAAAPSLGRLSSVFLQSSSSSSAAATAKVVARREPKPRDKLSGVVPSSSKAASSHTKSELTPGSETWLRTVMRSLFRERNMDKLITGFLAASQHHRFRGRHLIYEDTINRLTKARRPDAVVAVLEAQKRFPTDIAREGFAVRIISLYGKAGMPERASATFNELPALGCTRSVMSFNALLTAYFDARQFQTVVKLFKEIPASDSSIVPNLFSYNILLGALGKNGNLDAALDVLSSMENEGIEPNLVSFSTLINGLYGNGLITDGDKVMALMREKGLEPKVSCFNSKIRALIFVGRTEEAIKIVATMEQSTPKPNIGTYNVIIDGYCNNNKLEEANKVFNDLHDKGCAANKDTYKVLIPCLVKAGELNLALSYCSEGLKEGCRINAIDLRSVIAALVEESRVDETKDLVELAQMKHYYGKALKNPNKLPVSIS